MHKIKLEIPAVARYHTASWTFVKSHEMMLAIWYIKNEITIKRIGLMITKDRARHAVVPVMKHCTKCNMEGIRCMHTFLRRWSITSAWIFNFLARLITSFSLRTLQPDGSNFNSSKKSIYSCVKISCTSEL